VSNPTLGLVRVRLAGSAYSGEIEWDDKDVTTSSLKNVLVDPLTQVSVDAQLDTAVSKSFPQTEMCVLEAAEDSFLELGKTSDDIPENVAKWEAGDILFDSKVSKELPSSMRLVGQKKSVAWFELVLMELELKQKKFYCAVPMALQIQVGGGSWESSLVQSQQLEDGDPLDFVSFDLVVLWEKFD
jgi:hypothetical protein